MMVTFPPDSVMMRADFDPAAFGAEFAQNAPGLAERFEMDDGKEVVLQRHDVCVQHGTRHAWRNKTDKPATLLFVLVGAHGGGFVHKIEKTQGKQLSMAETPPLAEQAFNHLRKDILIGSYPAGAKLKVEELQEAYGFSSSPLREALSRLAQEGLVRADERRGFRVAPITAEDLADITRMRLMLDVQALAESIQHGGDQWEAAIVAAYYRLEKVESRLSEGPLMLDEEWSALHRDFHMALLAAACPSERQRNWSISLFDQAERYRRYSARHRETPRHKSNEHKKIMDAVLRRDTQTACALLKEHILGTQRSVDTMLKSVNGNAPG